MNLPHEPCLRSGGRPACRRGGRPASRNPGSWSVGRSISNRGLSMNLLSVAAGVPPAVEGGVPPPGIPSSWSVGRSISNRELPMNRTAAPPWNPNGIPSQSPGLDRAAGLPRVRVSADPQPQRGCDGRAQPRWGWSKYPRLSPRFMVPIRVQCLQNAPLHEPFHASDRKR